MNTSNVTRGPQAGGQAGDRKRAPIDWAEVRRRLETARAALERELAPSLEEKKRILKARAKSLAREATEQEESEAALELVEFLLAHENYGIETKCVREVYPLRELTPLPNTPPFVLGIVNVRGQLLPVIDIKKLFDLPEKGLTDLNKLIIVQGEGTELGILADAILGVRRVPLREIQPSLPTLTGIRAEYLKGVTKERMVILEVEKILSDRKIVAHEGAAL